MSMSPAQSPPTYHYQISDEDLIEIDYFQTQWDTNFTTTNRSCSCPNTFHISLTVDKVIRKFFFSPEKGESVSEDETVYDGPITEHCLLYVSEDHVCPLKLGRFMDATNVPPQIMSQVMDALWSFARKVVPVVMKDDGVMVRPLTMMIKLVKLKYYYRVIDQVGSSAARNDAGTSNEYGFYEDCLEKVRIDQHISDQSCSICFEDFVLGMDLRRLPCSHIYHGDCIVQWLGTKPTCPLCRFMIFE